MLSQCIKNNQRKILVCAPSNAAIDEIVTRLISKGGLIGSSEKESINKVVRIGSIEYEPSKAVQQVLFSSKMDKASDTYLTKEDRDKLEGQRSKWRLDLDNATKLLKNLSMKNADQQQIRVLAEAILSDKSQIGKFLTYDAKHQERKVVDFRNMTQKKLQTLDD